ncbi:MAG TPA: hypothetical protein VF214_01590 [Edaphobacter sp.]
MPSVSRPLRVWSLVLCLTASLTTLLAPNAAHAQASTGTSGLERQLERIDFGVGAAGIISRDTSGTNSLGQTVDHNTSSTAGALIQIRYTKSPWIGGEFNVGYARYSHNFTTTGTTTTPPSFLPFLSAQTNSFEFTLGYVAHPPHLIGGFQPFFGGGGGAVYFHPTSGGGEGLPNQAVGAFYYSGGVERAIVPHVGFRAQFRQLFYQSPDFFQNYLYNGKRSSTIEPTAGFYLHF